VKLHRVDSSANTRFDLGHHAVLETLLTDEVLRGGASVISQFRVFKVESTSLASKDLKLSHRERGVHRGNRPGIERVI